MVVNMKVYLDEEQINNLVNFEKELPTDFQDKLIAKPKRGHSETQLVIPAPNSEFRIIIRKSLLDPLDFSVILGYMIPKTNYLFRLRRYNGNSHEHTNHLENETFFGYHIHMATLRYQQYGFNEDEFAVQSNNYTDTSQAINCLIKDCNFLLPSGLQLSLLNGGFDGN